VTVPVIAIDGPSASGKGVVAARVAAALGFHVLESGALYRLVALAGPDDAERTAASMAVDFQGGRIFLSGQDVTDKLRQEEVGVRASAIAQRPGVRQALLARQRAFRRPPGLVAEGRDMGTVVFPDAALKVFLTATPQVRAERRYKQLIDKGIDANLHALSRDLAQRDARDAARAVAPLAPAPDALQLDTSERSLDEVVAVILGWCRERKLGGRPA
jgi:cytidylate kinase